MRNIVPDDIILLSINIESSTKLWGQHPEEIQVAIESNNECIIKAIGNGGHATFEKAIDTVHTFIHTQHNLFSSFTQSGHPTYSSLKVRTSLHTSKSETLNGNYSITVGF